MEDTLHDSPSTGTSLKEEIDHINNTEISDDEKAHLEGTVWRKLDRWVLPVCTIFYLLSFLDRSNIANARVAGMQTSLKMSNYQYSIALTMTYVPYIAAEFPSNLLLKYVGPQWMLPAMVTIWGLVATMQGIVKSYSGLLACRFFLGLMEGGLFPGLVLYMSFFYPRERLQIRIATFFASASLSGAFSGLLAAGIMNIDGRGGRPGWAWIFIIEGIFTLLFGCISFFVLPSSPTTAAFLSEKERNYVVSRLKADGALAGDDKNDRFSWTEVIRCCQSVHVWMLAPVLFFLGTTLYGLAYFEPSIVAGLGYTGNKAQLMSAPPFAVAFVVSMISAAISDRYGCRGFMLIFFSLCNLIGFVIFHASKSNHIRYGSLFLTVSGNYCGAPPVITWVANNSAPHVRRATSVAIAFIMTNAGGILATWLLGSLSPAPNYTKATVTFIIMSAGMVVLSSVNLAYLWHQNRLKAQRRQLVAPEDEPEDLGDKSAWFVYNL
ncbi:major facilitator superfamily domain-containing protein [Suillus paluster]|uniref:major facilitator superfamily domain-containing protein n=1 Tax=Suillus paluster TaxID=48578 RepID=UPI001B865DEB|nr:major facilitator superfamily domain-containing protein [Suillus paluster]KAG1735936.1 major facilitator superfamily domain-containing protein [Suillus paluster]